MGLIKTCDRPHKIVIGENDDYLPLVLKSADGDKEVDLCKQCGEDFKVFMQQNPAPTNAQVQQATTQQVPPSTVTTSDPAVQQAQNPNNSNTQQ